MPHWCCRSNSLRSPFRPLRRFHFRFTSKSTSASSTFRQFASPQGRHYGRWRTAPTATQLRRGYGWSVGGVCRLRCGCSCGCHAETRRDGKERFGLKLTRGYSKFKGEAIDRVASRTLKVRKGKGIFVVNGVYYLIALIYYTLLFISKVLVVGNPANTNAYIVSHYAPSIPKSNFTALTRLDDNQRSVPSGRETGRSGRISCKYNYLGNHSEYPVSDLEHVRVGS